MYDTVDGGGAATTTLPRIRVSALWWELGGNPSTIERTAQSWRILGNRAERRADNLVEQTSDLLASRWVGVARDTFEEHLQALVADLDEVRSEAHTVAGHLDGVASVLSTYQDALHAARTSIMRSVPSSYEQTSVFPGIGGGEFVFSPRDAQDVEAVRAAVVEAGQIRDEFNQALAGYPAEFRTQPWVSIASRWYGIVSGNRDPFEVPPEAAGLSLLWVDGTVVINTGPGDDNVTVTVDPETGEIIVDVNGTTHRFPPGTPITVRTGEGHDIIEVADGVNVSLVLLGGAGNDRIQGGRGNDIILGGRGNDDLFGGDGNDYISGGSDRDYIEGQGGNDRIFGGHGDDVIYGLGGNNYIAGGVGNDYIEGGKGNDTIDGGAGNDVISGGRGDDTLRGGGGDDVFYAGLGSDRIDGGSGQNTAYSESGDRVSNVSTDVRIEITNDAGFIAIEGSPEFIERVQADLDMMQSSPVGQEMLAELRGLRDPNIMPGEHTLTIRELENDFENHRPNQRNAPGENGFARSGSSSVFGNRDSSIQYNPSFTFDRTGGNPAVILYHELAHVYSYWNGNHDHDLIVGGPDDGIRKSERQATGLPYDHDDDPNTPDQIDPEQPLTLTENGMRAEMGLPHRGSYR